MYQVVLLFDIMILVIAMNDSFSEKGACTTVITCWQRIEIKARAPACVGAGDAIKRKFFYNQYISNHLVVWT